MPLPCSGRQLNALGNRLAEGALSEADTALFAQVVDEYQSILDQVERRLEALGFQATTRVKTTGTLVDKLRRDPTLKLKSIHDLAGARIIVDGSLRDQDLARDRIEEVFVSCPRTPFIKDRRITPSHGYRAVHVIVFPEGVPVEIQIRTVWQDRWAQAAEIFGDRWGRGLRYGLGPDDADSLAGPPFGPTLTRGQVIEKWGQASDVFNLMEQVQVEIDDLATLRSSGSLPSVEAVEAVMRRFEEARKASSSLIAELGTESAQPTVNEEQP